MRAYLPAYELKAPKDLPEALTWLGNEPGVWRPFAGGTDLMVLLEAGKLAHRKFVNIWNLHELQGIEATSKHVTLGALVTYTQLQKNPVLQNEFPILYRAASETGGLAIQNRGTLGGNIVNASPAADSPPGLLVYDAELELVSTRGARLLPYQAFHTGYKQTLMRPDEILSRIRLPRAAKTLRHYYRKVGTRKAQAISKVCFAGAAQMNETHVQDIRIALGSVAPTVIRCLKTENLLRDQPLDADMISAAKLELAHEIAPIDDIRSTANYRLRVALNLLEDFLINLRSGRNANQ